MAQTKDKTHDFTGINTSNDWMDILHQTASELSNLYYDIKNLSDTFRRIGNHTVADELLIYANQANEASKSIVKSTSLKVNGDLKASEVATANTLKYCLKYADRLVGKPNGK
jgi:hypothetical protein